MTSYIRKLKIQQCSMRNNSCNLSNGVHRPLLARAAEKFVQIYWTYWAEFSYSNCNVHRQRKLKIDVSLFSFFLEYIPHFGICTSLKGSYDSTATFVTAERYFIYGKSHRKQTFPGSWWGFSKTRSLFSWRVLWMKEHLLVVSVFRKH